MDSVIKFSHSLFIKYIDRSAIVVDMTVGNGYDTKFLVENYHKVYGFDIQEAACISVGELLKDYNNLTLINDSHEQFDKYINEEISGMMFNLGYLPGGNKEITTMTDVTLRTIKKGLKIIKIGGLINVVFYPGHVEGKNEAIVVVEYLSSLPQKDYEVVKYEFINRVNNPPFLVAIRRLR